FPALTQVCPTVRRQRILGRMAKTPYPRSDRELLARIGRSAGGKAGYKQLIRELGLGGGRERRLLGEQLERTGGGGELRRLEEGMWALPKREPAVDGSDVRAQGKPRWDGFEAAARSGRDRLVS